MRQGSAPCDPPRILMVVRLFAPWVGGTERQAQTLARGLADQGVSVRIVTGRWFRGTDRHEVIDGIPVFRHHTLWEFFGIRGLRRFGGYLYMITLYWHLWRTRASYDIVHVHGMNYHSAVAVSAARRLGKRSLTKLANSGRASDIEKMRHDRQLPGARHLLGAALESSRFVALNATVVDELRAAGVPESRIVSIPNGVSADGVRPKAARRTDGPVHAVYVGRLHEQKLLPSFLAAVAQVEECHPGRLRATLVGDGPQRRELENQVDRLGLGDVVAMPGALDDVAPVLAAADVFVLPSAVEGLSNALLEAMTHGLPVLVSRIPGNADVIDHGRNGLLFDPGDVAGLAEGLVRLADDPALRARLGACARADIERTYALERVVDRYIALYRDLSREEQPA